MTSHGGVPDPLGLFAKRINDQTVAPHVAAKRPPTGNAARGVLQLSHTEGEDSVSAKDRRFI